MATEERCEPSAPEAPVPVVPERPAHVSPERPEVGKPTIRGKRVSVSTAAFDQDLQGVGGGPTSRLIRPYSTGLRIPGLPPSTRTNRYQFMLAWYSLQANQRARIVSLRQMLEIGLYTTAGESSCKYPLVLNVTSPTFRFVDGNVAWGLTRIPGGRSNQLSMASVFNTDSMQFRYANGPALLFETAPAEAGGYSAPNGGAFDGSPIKGLEVLATFTDLRFPWQQQIPYGALDAYVEGPCDIAMWASVLQTVPGSRCTLTVPGSLPVGTSFIPPEDAFIKTFINTVYWRIAGGFDLEVEGEPIREPELFDPCAPRGPL